MNKQTLYILIIIQSFVSSLCYGYELIPYRIKLYSFYTASHAALKDYWFVPSIQDDFDVVIYKYPQDCPSGMYMTEGWKKTMMRKVNLIINAIHENWGKVFIYSDIDVQFLKSIKQDITKAIHKKDIVFQRDTPSGTLCAGFIVCRANEKTLKLFHMVKEYMIENDLSDQKTINYILRKSKNSFTDIEWGYLPVRFFGAGTIEARGWTPGRSLAIPHDIVMHHANWTEGIKRKIAQLRYVKTVVRIRTRLRQPAPTRVATRLEWLDRQMRMRELKKRLLH